MPTLLKKFILSFLSFLVLFFSVAPNFLIVNACATNLECAVNPSATGCVPNPNAGPGQQSSICSTSITNPAPAAWYNQGPLDFYQKVFDQSNNDIFGERYTYAQVTWVTYSLLGAIAGFAGSAVDIPAILQQIQTNPQRELNTLMDPKGKLAQTPDPMMNIISQFYVSPPASGTYWLSQKINNFSLVKKAYAAPTNSFGYSSLGIFQPLWSASRNIAYILIVIILLMVAFAVMFRLKISPQIVVTVQSALPRIVSALIFITFSYAIVGFLIDLMYLIFGVVVYGISSQPGALGSLKVGDLFNNFLNGNLFSQIFNTAGVGGSATILGSAAVLIGLLFIPGIGAALIPFVLGLFIAVIIFFIKIFIMLAQTYLSLVINLVFGPIIILAEAIPFIKMSAMGWFKSVVADIMVFLAVGLLFLAQSLITEALGSIWQPTTSWAPPYLGFNPFILKIMVWVGVWSILPNIRKMVYDMMEKRSPEVGIPSEFQGHGRAASEAFNKIGQARNWPGFRS